MIQLSHGYAGFFSFGLLVTIWSASSGFMSLMEALSIAYGTRDNRSYVKKRIVAILATVVAALFLLVCFGLWNLGPRDGGDRVARSQILCLLSDAVEIHSMGCDSVLMCLGINLINHFLPDVKHPWIGLRRERCVVALSFIGATGVFEIYLAHGSNMPTLYGALAGFIVLMLWIYLANLVLLIGAETDTAWRELKASGTSA